ncbi:DUF2279 domain-containing protein [Marivirga lumbricoides]|uniref:DUF2279 domain-containing protein n=1 Tax=Marivirga lumbricoides TaxID=1046115 RepID=A0A2T4DUG6_9BACT|nr:DUF2279 domain-containing protein [Marivirga lumbricoides]
MKLRISGNLFLLVAFCSFSLSLHGQDSLNRRMLKKLILTETVVYTGTMVGLGFIWYGSGERQPFTFFNDNNQWLQMDKAGHAFTAYHISNTNAILFQKAGVSKKKALLWSGIASTSMMLPIEILDGFSADYGASWGDFVANSIGAFLPFQQLIWEENYIHPKFSFYPSSYAELRPNTLGHNFYEQWLKDYNGQTYWLSANFNLLSKKNVFPDWLAFSLGYSGKEMVYGDIETNSLNGYHAKRQMFLSLDVDFSKIETQKKWLQTIFYIANLIKIPFPTLEWSENKVILHPVYF